MLLVGLCLGVFALFLVYPFGTMLLRGVQDPQTGSLTLTTYGRMLADPQFYEALMNTIIIALGTLIASLLLAVPMAWAVSRTDMPFRGFVRIMAVLTFATPSFLGAIAWVILLGPRGGDFNLFLRTAFGLNESPFNIFSLGGIIFVFSLYVYPYIFFAACTALDKMDPALEEAAGMLGANSARTTLTITLPLILPAVLAGGALAVFESVVNFGVPAIVGLPRHIETLTTRIFTLFQFPPDYEMAAATGVPIVIIVVVLITVQRLVVGRRTFVTVTGISTPPSRIELGPLRYVFAGFSLLVIMASILVPFVALLITALKRTFGNPIGLDNLSLQHFASVLSSSVAQRAISNSVLLAAGAAVVCMIFAVVLAWLVERTKLPGRGAISFLVMACFSFPGIALAVALIYAFSSAPLALYGTLWILLLAYSIRGLPIVFNYARIGLRQVHVELSDAAEILGARWARAFWDITVPLIRGGIFAGGILVFVLMLREFGSSVLLTSGGSEVVAVIIYEFAEEGDNGRMASLALIVFVVNLAFVTLAHRAQKAVSTDEQT
jgi:iron(III) transport system permease protein